MITQFIDLQGTQANVTWGGPQSWGSSQLWTGGILISFIDLNELGASIIITGNPIGLLIALTYT